MNFSASSQLARWAFSREQLANKRTAAREAALRGTGPAEEVIVTPEDERRLLRYYEKSILSFCQQHGYPLRVQSAALIYLKRFYLEHSVLSHDPSKLFMSCVYLACKVEEEYLPIENLVQIVPSLTENLLRKGELKLVKALNYDFIVHTPFRDDLTERLRRGEGATTGLESIGEVSPIRKAAYAATQCLLETDAPLRFTPSKLALAALRSGFKSNKKRLDIYLERVIQPLLPQDSDFTLQQELSEIDRLGVEGAQDTSIETDHVRRIDRSLKAWLKIPKPKV